MNRMDWQLGQPPVQAESAQRRRSRVDHHPEECSFSPRKYPLPMHLLGLRTPIEVPMRLSSNVSMAPLRSSAKSSGNPSSSPIKQQQQHLSFSSHHADSLWRVIIIHSR